MAEPTSSIPVDPNGPYVVQVPPPPSIPPLVTEVPPPRTEYRPFLSGKQKFAIAVALVTAVVWYYKREDLF
jgi:hypothetical protein